MYDFCILIISLTRDPYQIAAFSILALIPDIFMFSFMGVLAYPKAEIN